MEQFRDAYETIDLLEILYTFLKDAVYMREVNLKWLYIEISTNA